MIKSDFF